MTPRGILYVYWDSTRDDGRSPLAELLFSVQSARRTALPLGLVRDRRRAPDLDRLFDEVVEVDFDQHDRATSHILGRKLFGLLRSPFCDTLFLDIDTQIVSPDVDYGFSWLPEFGYAMAYDKFTIGSVDDSGRKFYTGFEQAAQALLCPGVEYLPVYNGGVMFFRRDRRTERLLQRAWLLTHNGVSLGNGLFGTVTDQMAVSLTAELSDQHPYGLGRIWNSRDHHDGRPAWQCTRILHAYQAVQRHCRDQGLTQEAFAAQCLAQS